MGCGSIWLLQRLGWLVPEVVLVGWVRLTFEERIEIAHGLRNGWSLHDIAAGLSRSVSTISREVTRNGGVISYHARRAQGRWKQTRCRPKPLRLEGNGPLARQVTRRLRHRWSPEQIACRLRREHPDDPRWWVSPEAIYHSLFMQGRGGLRDELTGWLRSQHPKRKRHVTDEKRGRIPDMVSIRERPAEVADRAVPGHWEGDLIVGTNDAIVTLVERSTRYVMLGGLPHGRSAPEVRDVLVRLIQRLPDQLRRSLTWDQGREMAQHVRFTVDSGVQVYFCDPRSPWQRGTNENTNGLLRQYFPKGEPIARYTQAQLDAVARQLNGRPRKTLGWDTPAEAYAQAVAITP
jgi:IS30 family transposase